MSYRRSGRTNENSEHVAGPNSALTAFLRSSGITQEFIERRFSSQRLGSPLESTEEIPEENGDAIPEEEVLDQIETETENTEDYETQIRIAARRKRRLNKENESDYTDSSDDDDNEPRSTKEDSKKSNKFLGPGQETLCYHCKSTFRITAFSKKIKDEQLFKIIGFLCQTCTKEYIDKDKSKREKSLQARKKRRKIAQALLEKEEIKFPSLQSLCIALVSNYIQSVENFGDIGVNNLNKICKIICKRRLLTDETLPLFLNPKITSLTLWDCSKLTVTAFKSIAAFAPNIKELDLTYCARLNDETFQYYIDKFEGLSALSLNGGFLIRDNVWSLFFQKFGKTLKSFKMKSSYRFSDLSVSYLLKNCSVLENLHLAKMDAILDKSTYASLKGLPPTLKHLEISSPIREDLITDEVIIEILESIGGNLESLILDDCTGLTDKFLIDGVQKYCGSELKVLSLKGLDQITDDGIYNLFHDWSSNSGLMELNLSRCIMLAEKSLIEVINHSFGSLIELNINSIDSLTLQFFEIIKEKQLPYLTFMDASFVRSVNNKVIKILGDACPKLKYLEVYGDNKCTAKAVIRNGLQVIGRQSDSI